MEEIYAEHGGDGGGDKLIEEREEKALKLIKSKWSWLTYGILAIIIWINIQIRSLPMKVNPATGKPGLWDFARDNWTLGPDLDPFLFLRYAKEIVAQGGISAIDMMRYVPLGFDTSAETQLLPHLIAYLHKLINVFTETSVEYSAVVFPVVASVFTTIFFFLLVRKVFEEKGPKISNSIALVAAAFMVVLPSMLTRTIAGIPEKESVGFAFMFLAFYFFLSAWKAKKLKGTIIFGVLAGAATALMGLTWGGVIFIYVSLAVTGAIALILDKVGKRQLYAYGLWLISSAVFWLPFTSRTTLGGFVKSPTTGSAVVVLVFFIVHFLLFKTKIKHHRLLNGDKIGKIPKPIVSIVIASVLIAAVGLVFFGSEFIGTIDNALTRLTTPYSDRLSFTVAENRQPYFSDWKGSMGPILKGVPLFFWLFFIGSMVLFFETMGKLKSKERWLITASYFIFLIAIIFSRTSPSSPLNGVNALSLGVYSIGYLALIAGGGYILFKKYKEGNLGELRDINLGYVLVFSLSFVGVVGARSAIRLIMLLTSVATILVGYLVVVAIVKAFKSKGTKKVLLIVLAILVVWAAVYTFAAYYNTSKAVGSNHIPSAYNQQWQKAMAFVRIETPEDAVFGHWWDYGYWVQSIGERATMLDGGNSIFYWNYLMGRHVLTAESEEEALELLYSHDVTHFLIDSTEIGKYSAYSSIGSDENYDRFSFLGTFLRDDKQTQETKNQTIIIYPGGTALDEDLIFNQNGKDVFIPRQRGGVAAIIVYQNANGSFTQPEVVIIEGGTQYRLPLRYLYVNGEKNDFGTEKESTLEAAAYVFPRVFQNRIEPTGAAMYLSPRNLRALWIRLYLLGEEDRFKLVHSEPSAIHSSLSSQGIEIFEIAYFQGIQGPIKIWEVQYTGKEEVNPEYVQVSFPERLQERIYR